MFLPILAWSVPSSSTLLIVGGTLAACVGLYALSRTRWGRRKPTHRYAVASIAAHLVLLGVASTIRYGGAQSGHADAPPIRVKIAMRAPAVPEVEPAPKKTVVESEPPAEVEPIKSPPAPQTTPVEPVPDKESVEALDPTIEASAVKNALPTIEPDAVKHSGAGDSPPHVESPAHGDKLAHVDREITPELSVQEPLPVEREASTPLAWDSPYATRGAEQRLRLAEEQGGSRATEDAVARGLDWIARSQRPDGAWDAVRWGAGQERRVLNHDRGGAGTQAETGLTGLALLALMGGGHTHLEGPYQSAVAKGLAFLIRSQTTDESKSDGDLAGHASLYARTYCHSMATFALAEALATSEDERLRPAVERAVGFLIRSQSGSTGGWRYRPGDRGDMSQMGWALMALRSAELAGVEVPPNVWSGIERFVASVSRGSRGGLAAYQPQGGHASPTMTAEALYCRQILGLAPGQPAACAEAVAALLTRLPTGQSDSASSKSAPSKSARPANLYYWYYATLALHHQRTNGHDAATAWDDWNGALKRSLLPVQVRTGRNAGSWTPTTLWGGYGGRVYSTAMATMCLEVYYRYEGQQIGRDPWIAAREGVLRR